MNYTAWSTFAFSPEEDICNKHVSELANPLPQPLPYYSRPSCGRQFQGAKYWDTEKIAQPLKMEQFGWQCSSSFKRYKELQTVKSLIRLFARPICAKTEKKYYILLCPPNFQFVSFSFFPLRFCVWVGDGDWVKTDVLYVCVRLRLAIITTYLRKDFSFFHPLVLSYHVCCSFM